MEDIISPIFNAGLLPQGQAIICLNRYQESHMPIISTLLLNPQSLGWRPVLQENWERLSNTAEMCSLGGKMKKEQTIA